jgi:hypothetical protein
MEDPLSVLRKYIINKWQIAINGDSIHFGNEYSWSGNVKTNYTISR